MPDRLVGHLEGRTLVDDVADRDEEGGAEGEQDGDIRFRHRRPPPVVHRTLPGAIAKAWAQSGATCFNSYQERSRHGDSWWGVPDQLTGAALRGRCADDARRARGNRP
ncbi:hypothetical protein GCM10009645_25670 [Mycolicibacterium poriferae]|uniref:Uncharacterized protein n=1 Tax=Mycolicibacterium poriferae TaxID=39694 RepID=A0A6N4VCB1_9MYCO|nr:hypothetical protein MPOR_27340 [Mycolicibacterium poriferae]